MVYLSIKWGNMILKFCDNSVSVCTGQWILRFVVLVLCVCMGNSQSCGPRVSARLLTVIPCDMSINSYCTAPGSAYPWQSVKRYIFDNQGLVRRMYGDERHNLILSKEMHEYSLRYNPHFLEPRTIVRYGRGRAIRVRNKPGHRRRQSRPQIFKDDDDDQKNATSSPTTLTATTSNPTPTEETIFRVVTRTSIEIGGILTTTTQPVSPTTMNKYNVTKETTGTDTSSDSELTETFVSDDVVDISTFSAPYNSSKSTETTEPMTSNSEMTSYDPPEKVSTTNSTSGSEQATASSFETSFMDTYVSTEDVTDDPGPYALERTSFDDDYDYSDQPKRKYAGFSHNSVEEKNKNKDYDETVDVSGSSSIDDVTTSTAAKEQTTPEDLMMEETEVTSVDEKEEEVTVPRRGINACPVKNEVIAPYWANNTRGETLALLNVYPFEQYVHFEKCAFENHQMLCREGCRCEQQYRLHRLLAFDPKNECRGIFSDWFRFPSCCVCICYDIAPDVPRSRTGRS